MATLNIGQTPQSVTLNIFMISQLHYIRISTGTLVNTVNIIISFFCVKSSILGGWKLSRLLNNAASELQPQTLQCDLCICTCCVLVMSKLQTSIKPVVLMPAERHCRQWDCHSNNPGYEVCVWRALEHVASIKYTSLQEAAQRGVSHHHMFFYADSSHIALKILRSMLSDRAKNCHVSFTESLQWR